MNVELVCSLAKRFENFIMFKDSSGEDRVARSGKNLAGVVTLRGAEGDYARWLNGAGGPYYGFLLSTANCFALELGQIVADVSGGRLEDARRMSGRLTAVINEVFRLAASLKDGNPFTNANKAIDHFFAHGPPAAEVQPPQVHAGTRLPAEVIRATGEILSRHGFMPVKGYLD
jgi:dihydrodipicolinate synthase/N-acetylneuraminate lyase